MGSCKPRLARATRGVPRPYILLQGKTRPKPPPQQRPGWPRPACTSHRSCSQPRAGLATERFPKPRREPPRTALCSSLRWIPEHTHRVRRGRPERSVAPPPSPPARWVLIFLLSGAGQGAPRPPHNLGCGEGAAGLGSPPAPGAPRDTGASPKSSRLPKQEDFHSPLKSHLELSPGIKPGLSLARFSISARACLSKKVF